MMRDGQIGLKSKKCIPIALTHSLGDRGYSAERTLRTCCTSSVASEDKARWNLCMKKEAQASDRLSMLTTGMIQIQSIRIQIRKTLTCFCSFRKSCPGAALRFMSSSMCMLCRALSRNRNSSTGRETKMRDMAAAIIPPCVIRQEARLCRKES